MIPQTVSNLDKLLSSHGAKAYLVGGAVIDMERKQVPKDWDIEVHGISMDKLEGILEELCPKQCGQSFGIFKLPSAMMNGLDIDISIPRRESSIGTSHTDFLCDFDPSMTPEEAARRRDFTINAMFYDIATGEIVDPYGGLKDLKDGVLRMTCPEKFTEDTLRAMRAMQLVARKCKVVDPETTETIRGMVDSFGSIARERIYEEFKKLLLMADKPSVGLTFLKECGWLACFPELHNLAYWPGWEEEGNEQWREQFDEGCPHNPKHHPEGNVWVHTLMVVDNAASVREFIPEEDRLAFMFGALCHDLAKATTTVLPECHAKAHDVKGVALAKNFLSLMTNEKKVIETVGRLVHCHMQPWQRKDAKDGSWKRLHGDMDERLDLLGWLTRCDWGGRPSRTPWPTTVEGEEFDHVPSKLCFQWHDDLGVEPIKPILMGRHLKDAGLEPGPEFTPRLDAAFEAQLDNPELTRPELLEIAINFNPRD